MKTEEHSDLLLFFDGSRLKAFSVTRKNVKKEKCEKWLKSTLQSLLRKNADTLCLKE